MVKYRESVPRLAGLAAHFLPFDPFVRLQLILRSLGRHRVQNGPILLLNQAKRPQINITSTDCSDL